MIGSRRAAALLLLALATSLRAQDSLVTARNDSLTLRLVDVDIKAVVQLLGRYTDRPIVIGNLTNVRVTFETPRPIPRAEVTRVLRGILESQNMELVTDSVGGIYRVRSLPPNAGQAANRPPAAGAPRPPGSPELFVIRLKHARAADVAATVNALYGRSSAFGEPGAPTQTLSQQLQQNQAAPVGAQPTPGPPAGAGQSIVRAASLAGEVTIVPDAKANSLLIRATQADYELIRAAVTELDIRPLQVLIEVMIAELRKDRGFDFGVGTTLPSTPVRGRPGVRVEGSTIGIGTGDFALHVMGLAGANVDAVIVAAAARGDATIVSRPVLLAANNERAEISVGSQRPFVQVARVLPTDNTARDQVVQYKDVGTKLTVIPTISTDGSVMLQVTQEVNAATTEQQFNAPIISTRSVDTKLLVNNGQTIVLGGLTDRQRERSAGGVPFFSSLPWIGGFFGRVSHIDSETELYLFLTPHVIASDSDAVKFTDPYSNRAKVIKP